MQLRSYQEQGVDLASDTLAKRERACFAAPMGTGKSVIELAIQSRGEHYWIVTPRVEIIKGMLEKKGLTFDNEQDLLDMAWALKITTPIRLRNALIAGRLTVLPSGLIIDEGHHIEAETYQQILLCCGKIGVVLFTATPFRGTPKSTQSFRETWGEPKWLLTYNDAVKQGFMKLPVMKTVPLVDDDLIEIGSNGELMISSIEAATKVRLHSIVDLIEACYRFHEDRYCGFDKPTIVSLPSTNLVHMLEEACIRKGIHVAVVTQETPYKKRQEAFESTLKCATVLLQINVVSEGVDLPLRRLIDASPTLSPVKWTQQVGRITRPTDDDAEYLCLAEGTPILTDAGWVAIEDVNTDHLVWDGVDWVSHDGVLCTGVKPVVAVKGVHMTPQHKVFTDEGMIEAWQLRNQQLSGKYLADGRFLPSSITQTLSASADVAENCPSITGTSNRADLRNVNGASHKLRDLVPGLTLGPTSHFELGTQQRMLCVDALIRRIDSMAVMEDGGSLFALSGLKTLCGLSSTYLPSKAASTLSYPLIESTTIADTNRGTYVTQLEVSLAATPAAEELSRKKVSAAITESTGLLSRCESYTPKAQPCVRSGVSTVLAQAPSGRFCKVYDIVNAGPRHRYQAGPLIVANCTNRNLFRHAYVLEGIMPSSAILQAQGAFPLPSSRAGSRVVGLEALGRLKPATVRLGSGLQVTTYAVSTTQENRVVEYFAILHPRFPDPVWAKRVDTKDELGQRVYGRWQATEPPKDLQGFASIAPKAISEKQEAWWSRSAKNFGLDAETKPTRKEFQILPVLKDLQLRLAP